MAQHRVLLEIGPLKEGNYTGIAQVTAALAEQMLGDESRQTGFFFGRAMVEDRIVEDIVRRRNGELLPWYLQRAPVLPAPDDLRQRQIAVFPNRKTCRRGFDVECQVVHDLSTLLTPQFHNDDTISYHATTLLEDVQSNDLTFCVSEATRQDVLGYLGPLRADRVVAVPLAASIPPADVGRFAGRAVEPYVLVLGTIEPRKNVEVVLAYLRNNREMLRRTRFVFLGRFGWGETVDSLLRRLDLLEPFKAGRIVFPGFVAESAKNALIENAHLLIYPSLFEGFGLPVLEAMTLGVPCITTRSSSIPEVGGGVCYYFDPHIPGDFDRVLVKALVDVRMGGGPTAQERRDRASSYSWAASYRRITDAIDALLAER
jgi:glycosyltransferase involved in cell wall biosynthesis